MKKLESNIETYGESARFGIVAVVNTDIHAVAHLGSEAIVFCCCEEVLSHHEHLYIVKTDFPDDIVGEGV